jgi:hypothetical protein
MIRRLVTLISVAAGLLALPVHAEQTCVNGRCVSVRVPDARRAQLKNVATKLSTAGVPGYGVLYQTTKYKKPLEGAMLVTAVDRNTPAMQAWYDAVAPQSVGFQASMGPAAGGYGTGSGYLRVGTEWMSYNWVRGGQWGSKENIRDHSDTLTEATFLVNPQEMAAFKAFYYARNKMLIKGRDGKVINPNFRNPGKCDLKNEACAGAASSALNPAWLTAFSRSLREIKAFGQANNVPELANAPDNAAQLLSAFLKRTGAHQQADPRALVRLHSTSADMLTVFNASLGSNPQETLKWARDIQWYVKDAYSSHPGQRVRDKNHKVWLGLGNPSTILDLHASEKSTSFKAERLDLGTFARGL